MSAPDLPTLRATLARLEAADGPDRELDAAIHASVRGYPVDEFLAEFNGEFSIRTMVPAFTASIDAAVALVERALPGRSPDILCEAIDLVKQSRWPGVEFMAALRLAILTALFRALIAKEEVR